MKITIEIGSGENERLLQRISSQIGRLNQLAYRISESYVNPPATTSTTTTDALPPEGALSFEGQLEPMSFEGFTDYLYFEN